MFNFSRGPTQILPIKCRQNLIFILLNFKPRAETTHLGTRRGPALCVSTPSGPHPSFPPFKNIFINCIFWAEATYPGLRRGPANFIRLYALWASSVGSTQKKLILSNPKSIKSTIIFCFSLSFVAVVSFERPSLCVFELSLELERVPIF